ncbi:T7SS effector LXG polymorphic toxin [Carnobacterium gallinarum]|uniref:T7SS effector LXG polymorphic toxin n=1 Tax=Carnobacterium gallinarum TaxID=2749 RepID=UPI000557F801|nr:T7SS effector LXG polymorphic toxin [Carnobacterium gallinarum]
MPRIDYQELKDLSEEVTKLRQETVSYLKEYDKSNDLFTEDRELLGAAWSSGKQYHGQYKMISDAIFNALYDLDDSIKNYLKEFKNIVGEAENRLDTEELQELENDLRRLQTQKLEFMEAMAEVFKDVPVLKEFFGNNTMNGRMKEIEVLKHYEHFENTTQGNFDGVKETIQAILEGLAYLGQSKHFESGASGYRVEDISGSSWYKHISGYNKANEKDRYEVKEVKTKYGTFYQVLKNGKVDKDATEAYNEILLEEQWDDVKDKVNTAKDVVDILSYLIGNTVKVVGGGTTAIVGVVGITGAYAVVELASGGTATIFLPGVATAGVAVAGTGTAIMVDGLNGFQNGYEGNVMFSNNGKITSKTFGKPIEVPLNGTKRKLRVDAEPDGNKIQIQSGGGKDSFKDDRILIELITDKASILKQIEPSLKKKLSKGKLEELVNNIWKAYIWLTTK